MRLEIVLRQEEDGTYSVHCPALKGCHSQGTTREEALKNIREAFQLYFEVANEKARRGIEQQPKSIVIEDAGMTEKRLLPVSGKQMVNTNRW